MDSSRLRVTRLSTIVFNCVAIFLCFDTSTGVDQKSGPYKVVVASVGECLDPGTGEMQMHVRLSRSSKTDMCFSGWYYLPYGMTDDLQELWTISMRGSTGGWKRLLSFRNRHACSDRKRLFPEWFAAIRATNMSDGECPVPPGNYTFGCLTLLKDLRFGRAKQMIYGAYKGNIRFYRNHTNIGCVLYEANVYPAADVDVSYAVDASGPSGNSSSSS